MGIEARLIFMNGVVVTPQLSLLDQWLSAFTKINTCPYNCTVKQISIFHNMLKHIHVFCTYIIFMQRFAVIYCRLQEENTCYGRPCFHHSEQTARVENVLQRALNSETENCFYNLSFCESSSAEYWHSFLLSRWAGGRFVLWWVTLQSCKQNNIFSHFYPATKIWLRICCKKLALPDVWFETLLEILLKWSK